jgi:hypothetical protein
MAFHEVAGGYRVDVRSPAGDAAEDFSLPFSDTEIQEFLDSIRQALGSERSPEVHQAAKDFGLRLFDAVFKGRIENLLHSSLHQAQRDEVGLRIRLRLADVPKLLEIPWELLPHPTRRSPFVLSSETPLVRHLAVGEPVRPLSVVPPLKVLAVFSNPINSSPLETETEWESLCIALRGQKLLTLERITNATRADLVQWLQQETCHILHFIGHGSFDPESGEGRLLFCDDSGQKIEATGDELGMLLQGHESLRLVVLNACEGGRSSLQDSFSGVAQALVRHGVPAVTAMQFKILDQAAISFSAGFYSALATGLPVDSAVSEGRRLMLAVKSELEACIPALYLRGADGRIFDLPKIGRFKQLIRRATVPFLALLLCAVIGLYLYSSLGGSSVVVEAGDRIEVRFEGERNLATLFFPLVVRSAGRDESLVNSISASLSPHAPGEAVRFADSEIQCTDEYRPVMLPSPIPVERPWRLDCVVAKELGAKSVRRFLTPGNFRLEVNLEIDDNYQSVEICYFLGEAMEELKAGEVKTIVSSRCWPDPRR